MGTMFQNLGYKAPVSADILTGLIRTVYRVAEGEGRADHRSLQICPQQIVARAGACSLFRAYGLEYQALATTFSLGPMGRGGVGVGPCESEWRGAGRCRKYISDPSPDAILGFPNENGKPLAGHSYETGSKVGTSPRRRCVTRSCFRSVHGGRKWLCFRRRALGPVKFSGQTWPGPDSKNMHTELATGRAWEKQWPGKHPYP